MTDQNYQKSLEAVQRLGHTDIQMIQRYCRIRYIEAQGIIERMLADRVIESVGEKMSGEYCLV